MSGGTTQSEDTALTRVLVVGDGQVSEQVAEQQDFDPLTERTVDDAIVCLERERVDCVIATPELSAPDFVRRLRDTDPLLPILLVVPDDSPTTVTAALEAGADDVVSETHLETNSALLARRVRNVIASHRDSQAEQRSRTQDDLNQAGNTGIALFENVGSPVAYVEHVDGYPRIHDVNPAFAETFGVDRSGVIGADIDEIVASQERRAEAVELSKRAHTETPEAVEIVRDTVNGPCPFLLRLASVDDENERLFAVYVDISERKQRERDLEQLNERISSLHEAAHRLLTAESESAVYEETVRAAIDILDFDWCVTSRPNNGRFELTAASAESPFEVGDAPLAVGEGTSGQAFETGESDLTNDMLADSQGEPADDAIRSGLTVPLGKFGIFQAVSTEPSAFDETDRELAELLVAHTQEALHWLERTDELERQNERLEQFASAVSHDLRNPLNIAQGRLELARETEELSHLEAAERALDRMNSIIEDVLALARDAPSVEPESVDIGSIARTAWSMVNTGDASLEVEADDDWLADAGRLQRVFENLFRNSIEHGNARTIRIETLDRGFAVVDDGNGFENAETALEMGASADGGTGLGLAIVKRIADAHGWTVAAKNEPDAGARIEVRGVRPA